MIEQNGDLLDGYFAKFLASRSSLEGNDKSRFQELVKKLSASLEAGHSCLPVNGSDEQLMMASPLVSDGGKTPLVVTKKRLYLHRYYRYEKRLAAQIRALAETSFSTAGDEPLLSVYFGDTDSDPDYQKEAARLAISKGLTIICGGPGTGKTTTVVKILCLLLQKMGLELKIALAAPTGKAAMRLSESIANSLNQMKLDSEMRDAIPVEAKTLHRLLGVNRNSPQFRHNSDNPMNWDVVIVDEASMVDLGMMSKLVDALKPESRLILLGDKDQLASVESGAVLGDFIESLPSNRVELQKTFRFDDNIKHLAECINISDGEGAWEALTKNNNSNVTILAREKMNYIYEKYAVFMEKIYQDELDVRSIFCALNEFQVLCGSQYGKFGVEGVNRRVEQSLVKRGFECREGSWYSGRPVLITRNDYGQDLYNGDIGICLPDQYTKKLKVWVERSNGDFKSYPPYRLPSCKTVFAMTIHKSQGSEFDEVVVVLPQEENRILSRELIYTAVTRAKKSVKIVSEKEILTLALSKNIERFSGLADLLVEGADKNT